MQRACEEAEGMDTYDYYVVNDELDEMCGRGSSDYPGRTQQKLS